MAGRQRQQEKVQAAKQKPGSMAGLGAPFFKQQALKRREEVGLGRRVAGDFFKCFDARAWEGSVQRLGLVSISSGWQYGNKTFAAAMRWRIGAGSCSISANSHTNGSSVAGKPLINLALLRLPAGLPAPCLRPPHVPLLAVLT